MDAVRSAWAETATQSMSTAPSGSTTGSSASADGTPAADDGLISRGSATNPDLSTGPTGSRPVLKTVADVVHAEISHGIQGTATWMDSFFGNRRYRSESNQSYIRFRYNMFFEKGTPALLKPDLQVRIVLPQLKETTHLVFSGMPKESTDFTAMQSGAPAEQAVSGEQRAVAAVDQTFFESVQQNFMVRAGAKLHNFKPVILLGPRYRVLFPLDSWNLRFIEEVVWTSNVGFESRTTVDLERPLPRGMFFRTTTEWYHLEHAHGYTYGVSFILGHPLSSVSGVSYEWVNIFQTMPVHELTEIDLRVRYRQRLWRDWLYFEAAPQYRFPRNRSFEATPGILFRVEMTMGNYEHPSQPVTVAP